MKKPLSLVAVLGGLALLAISAAPAEAHCDAVDGPVATAAVRALDQRNVNLVLPYVAASGETEVTAAFEQALAVRATGADAQQLADRYFMETAVRVHRLGEHAPYTGLKPAGTDFGPAIPAADRAIERGDPKEVLALLAENLQHGIEERFHHVLHTGELPAQAKSKAEVDKVRKRVAAELEFARYVEGIYAATHGAAHQD